MYFICVPSQIQHPLEYKFQPLQNLVVPQRQLAVKEFALDQHLHGMLSCVFELLQFAQPLQCAPLSSGALLSPQSDRFDAQQVSKEVMRALKEEWELVLALEAEEQTQTLLARLCPYTLSQCYREIATCLEHENWTLSERGCCLIGAYLPKISSSANVEDSFSTMADAVSRTGKSDCGSLPNLQCVHIRGVNQKMTGCDSQGQNISLDACDFEGPEIRGIKPKLFLPSSFNAGSFYGTSSILF